MRRILLKPILSGAGTALLLSFFMTMRDYLINPGGIFHNESETNWQIVSETFFSWFWPALIPLIVLAVLVAFIFERVKRRNLKPQQPRPDKSDG